MAGEAQRAILDRKTTRDSPLDPMWKAPSPGIIGDPPHRRSPAAVIHLMRLAAANPRTEGRSFRSSLIELARRLNAELPKNARVLLARDPRCREPFPGANPEEISAAGLIAIGAYAEDERESARQAERQAAFLMLERYFVYCRAMAIAMETHGEPSEEDVDDEDDIHDPGIQGAALLAHWFAALCPVIEGFRKLRLSDPALDALLEVGDKDGMLGRLLKFRHGVFHYQRRSDDPRFAGFMNPKGDAVVWALRLEREFNRFFLHHRKAGYAELYTWLTQPD